MRKGGGGGGEEVNLLFTFIFHLSYLVTIPSSGWRHESDRSMLSQPLRRNIFVPILSLQSCGYSSRTQFISSLCFCFIYLFTRRWKIWTLRHSKRKCTCSEYCHWWTPYDPAGPSRENNTDFELVLQPIDPLLVAVQVLCKKFLSM